MDHSSLRTALVIAATLSLASCTAQLEGGDDPQSPTYSSFSGGGGLCTLWGTGYDSNGNVTFQKTGSGCSTGGRSVVFSVTHENKNNNHIGDANYQGNISAYMADYDLDDVGTWLKGNATTSTHGGLNISLALDTMNYPDTTPSGRPNYDGYLFFGVNDISSVRTLGEEDCEVSLGFRVLAAETVPGSEPNGLTPGSRFILGFLMEWQEPAPRTNTAHFLEINLYRSDGFHSNQPHTCPNDGRTYDHCFYSTSGQWAEGQYLAAKDVPGGFPVSASADWRSVSLPVTKLAKSLNWYSKPSSWKGVRITPYYGIETKGKSRIWVETSDARLVCGNSQGSSGNALIRVGQGAYVKSGSSYCSLSSGSHLAACGYSQGQYDNAPQYSSSDLAKLTFTGACTCSSAGTAGPSGLFRVGSAGYIGSGSSYCSLSSGSHLAACGYSQGQYDNAPQYSSSDLAKLTFAGACSCK